MIRRALVTVVVPIVFGYCVGYALTGCGLFRNAQLADPEVPAKLQKCREEAREAFYEQNKGKTEALQVYEECKKREGL